MPKAIKRKAAKPPQSAEDVGAVLARMRETADRRKKQIVAAAVVVVAAAALVAGVFLYRSGVEKKARALEYEGYKQSTGLYSAQKADDAARAGQALETFSRAYELRKTPFSLLNIASARYALGKYAEAASALEEFIRQFPEEKAFLPLARYELGMARLRAGDNDAALKAFDGLSRYGAGPFGDLALMEAARLLEGMGKTDEARSRYESLARDYPQSPFVEEARRKAGIEEKPKGNGKEG